MTDLLLTRGDTNEITLTITALDSNGVAQPVSLVGASLWFTIKAKWDDPDVDAIVIKTIGSGIAVSSPPTAGIAVVTLAPADTDDLDGLARLVYDAQLKEADSTITTVARGYVTILRDVTRAII